MMLNPAYSNGKSPNRRVGALRSSALVRAFCGGARIGLARRRLALGAVAIYRSELETAFFQPALDPVFGEADVRFNPGVGNETAHTIKNAMIQ